MKRTISLILSLLLVILLCSCGKTGTGSGTGKSYNITVLKGPTGMGFSKMIYDCRNSDEKDAYKFNIISDPTMIVSSLATGEADIAACPLNMAALLYNKTQGNIRILAVNTMGTLYILDRTGTVHSISDLEGKTLVTSGKNTVPAYVLQYLLDNAGLTEKVNIEYKSEHSEVAAAILSGNAEIVMLPEPNVSVVISKDSSIQAAVDVSAELKNLTGTDLAMGCIIAKKKFVDENVENDGIERFLKNYEKSIDYINSKSNAGKIISEVGIVDDSAIAQKAVPGSSIVFLSGDEMVSVVNDNFKILFDENPVSLGGKIPDEDIFYK